MPIEIIRADESIHVDQLVITIYGAPGLGKTTLGFMADRPLLLDFDKGAQRAGNRKDSVRASDWSDVESLDGDDLKGYATVVVDTAGRALDALANDIMAKNDKMGNNGALTLQGYGQLKSRFAGWVKHLQQFGVDIIFIAHSTEEKSGDVMVERLDMQGASKNELYKVSDAIGRLTVFNKRRTLDFTPGDVAFGKDPAGLGRLTVPDVAKDPAFFASTVADIKASLNALSADQKARMEQVEGYRQQIAKLDSSDACNAFIKDVMPKVPDNLKRIVKGLLHDRAKGELGLIPDRDAGGYREPPEEAGPDEGDRHSADAGGPGT